MYENLGNMTLKSGEVVEACVVAAPDRVWASRVIDLLGHKPGHWREHIKSAMTRDTGIDICFYLLVRDGVPFSNISIASHEQVGLLGHVFTVPDDRRQGAASALMDRSMKHFRKRGGEALFLGTGYDSPPYHLYKQYGFRSIEPQGGIMEWYAGSKSDFDNRFFRAAPVAAHALDWTHWPTAAPLLCGGWTGVVRCAPAGVVGRVSSESPLMDLIFANESCRDARQPPRSFALVRENTSAVVGLAAWGPDKVWPATSLVDVYCHPEFWAHAGKLLNALQPPPGHRQLAYADGSCPAKHAALEAGGFRKSGVLPIRIATDQARTGWTDVLVYEKL